MSKKTIYEVAEERAQLTAPKPKQEPGLAGVEAAVLSLVVSTLFGWFTNLSESEIETAGLRVAVVVGGVVYGYFKLQERAHYRALDRELETLRRWPPKG
jgi:hypothetical protein